METDEMELDTIGDRKTALFVIISDTDDTFNFVVSILYTQLFNLLCDKADDEYGGRLPVHVRCLLDEFANIGQIPKFEKLIATIRSREISASIILQSQSQLKAIYKDNADTIVGNCVRHAFLGRQGENDAQRNIGNFRQGNNRQLQHFRNQRAGAFAWAELSEIGKGAYDTGRNRGHGRREMYLAATRGAPVLFGQIRHNEAPEIQVPVRCRPEERL